MANEQHRAGGDVKRSGLCGRARNPALALEVGQHLLDAVELVAVRCDAQDPGRLRGVILDELNLVALGLHSGLAGVEAAHCDG